VSAQHIYTSAPLGSLIRYSNGKPRPPARFRRKLRAWEHENWTCNGFVPVTYLITPLWLRTRAG